MFNNKRKLRLVAAAITMCFGMPPVFAANTTEKISVAAEIKRISESTAILSAQKAELDLRSQIATKQAELDKNSGQPSKFSGASNSPTIASEQDIIPVINGIEGIDGKLAATLSFGRGIQQTANQGEKIRGGWTINQITVSSVFLTRGKEKIRLSFGSEPQSQTPAAGSTAFAYQGGASIPPPQGFGR